jgi:NAD(P)-dependent dehydrogenase (short-subunit alcohol dehydrogenase family)
MFDLTNKISLVTGAEQGIGKSTALALASQGATVIITGLHEKKSQAIAQEIIKKNGKAEGYKMDVTSKKEIDKIISKVIKKYGRLDILVNNAGIYLPKPALDITEKDWDLTLTVNLKGQFLCAQRAAKEMAKKKWGRIINIASIASGQVGVGVLNSAHYTASKGGVTGMTETLALEWAPLGITVNAIGPGAIDTPMTSASNIPKKQKDAIFSQIPLKRFGKPEEIAATAVYLASEEAAYTTGATIFVDGGWLAS